jgi:hypothetical protein
MSSAAVMQQSKGWLHTAKPSRTGAVHQAELTANQQKVALYNRSDYHSCLCCICCSAYEH